jgi:hypothetical protein
LKKFEKNQNYYFGRGHPVKIEKAGPDLNFKKLTKNRENKLL